MKDFETCDGGLELHNTPGIATSHGYRLLIVYILLHFFFLCQKNRKIICIYQLIFS